MRLQLHTNPRYAMTLYQLNSDLLTIENPQVVRVFYKDSETGKDIYPSATLGENGINQQNLPAIIAPKISGYSLRNKKSIEYQSASVSKEVFLKNVQELPGDFFKDPQFLASLSKEFDKSFGGNPLSSLSNYVDQSLATRGFPNLPYSLAFIMAALAYDKKSTNLFDYLQTNVTKFSDSDTIQGLKLSTNPQAVVFWYNKNSSTPTTPTTPTVPDTPSTPITSSSSSSSAPTSSTSTSTPAASSSSIASSDNANLPSYVAAKGAAVYSVNKIGLYKSTKFSAANRSAWYTKKPRIYRPMFVVTGYKRAANGTLRYRVRDVNHTSKTNGKTGYITASQKYVRPVYYATKHSTVTVINPRGVNAYHKANLTKKARNYRQGTVLHVKRIVTHNLTTRYVLTNGDYITANRKLVNMGRNKQVKSVKTKRTLNRYSNANFTKKNQVIAKNRTLKVYGYDYSQKNNVTKHGTLRYRVAGGYITANTKYVRDYK